MHFLTDQVTNCPPRPVEDTREPMNFVLVKVVIQSEPVIPTRGIVWTSPVEVPVPGAPLRTASRRQA